MKTKGRAWGRKDSRNSASDPQNPAVKTCPHFSVLLAGKSDRQQVPLSRSCLPEGSAGPLAGDPWKGSTRDTLGLPAGSLEGGSDPELPSAARLGGDRLPITLSGSETMELKVVWDPAQAWPACRNCL